MTFNWRKTALVLVDMVLAAYLVLAITAFNKPDETSKVCTKVIIKIQDERTNGFITGSEIKKRLTACKLYPYQKPLRYVDSRRIESLCQNGRMLQDAGRPRLYHHHPAYADGEGEGFQW